MTASQTTGPTPGSTSTSGVKPPPLRVSTPPGSSPNPSPPAGPPPEDPVGDGPPTGTPSPGKPVNLPASASSLPRILVLAATLWLHDRLAPPEPADQDDEDAWIATPDEAAQIADPLTSIATRHLIPQSLTGDLSPDTADLITAGIGVAGYVGRNIWDAITRFLRRRKQSAPPVDGVDDHPMGATT